MREVRGHTGQVGRDRAGLGYVLPCDTTGLCCYTRLEFGRRWAMEEKELIHRLITSTGALYENGHYRYSSALHGSVYVEKDRVLANVDVASKLCYRIARHYFTDRVQVVTGPSMGGAMMA